MDKNARYFENLGTNWRFMLGEQPRAWMKGYDDSAWRVVTIPHDWSVEHPFSTDHSSGTGYLPGGAACYRRAFRLDESLRGKRVVVTFDGVYNHSSVWINGYYLGGHPYGYSQFHFDITPFATFGEDENMLVVKVDHRNVADSRWFTGSGIYRKVTVCVRDAVSVKEYGVFVTTQSADASAAKLLVKTSIENSAGESVGAVVKQTLLSACGDVVAEASSEVSIRESTCVEQELHVKNPSLWSPDSPALYTCVTTIARGGEVIDEVRTPVGIRTFAFDAQKGFFLNGVNMKMKGVCVHHDAGCLGAAVRPKVWRRRLEILKGVGCNAIRMSHNPHMPELYDLCDEMGFLVMEEAFDEWEGVKNKWAVGHNVYPPSHYGYYEDFPLWHEADLSTMVMRGRNHPSIVMWSIGNEIDYPNDPYCHPSFGEMTGNNDANKPKQERVYDPTKPNAERLVSIAKELVAIVKKHDTTRPVTAALAFPQLSNLTGLADVLDVVGYNYMERFYLEDHGRYPNRPLLGSENGKEVDQWLAVLQNEFISSQFLWTGYDFLGETRGWPSRGSKAGLFDLAGFAKPLAYLRAALWLDRPYAKLLVEDPADREQRFRRAWPLSWNFPEGKAIDVVCYTNCADAELFLNGKSLGKGKTVNAYTLRWEVTYAPGELKVVAAGKDGGAVEDRLETIGMPCAIRLESADGALVADGLDMAHIVATVVDAQGRHVPNAENMIHVQIEGGALMGLENGCQEDTQPYALPYRRAYNGKLLIYVGAQEAGETVSVRVSSDTLMGAELLIPYKK